MKCKNCGKEIKTSYGPGSFPRCRKCQIEKLNLTIMDYKDKIKRLKDEVKFLNMKDDDEEIE